MPPFLSSDIYRYVWDGRVQAAGINPYRYVPADPAFVPLRDTAIYPHINRADYARTIYPPVAQLVFAAVARIWDSVTAMRLAMVGFEALGIVCVLVLLPLAGLPRERILIYAWNPLPVWAIASDGHVDAIVVGLAGPGPAPAGPASRRRRRSHPGRRRAGQVLSPGARTRLPARRPFLAPGAGRRRRHHRGLWRSISARAGTCSASCPATDRKEGFAGGSGIWSLAGLGLITPLPALGRGDLRQLVAAVGAFRRACRRHHPPRPAPANDVQTLCRDTALLAAVAMAAVSPHYYWYFAWLALPAVLAPSRAVLWLATAPLLLIIGPIPGDQFILARFGLRSSPSPGPGRPWPSPSHYRIQAAGDIVCPLRSP